MMKMISSPLEVQMRKTLTTKKKLTLPRSWLLRPNNNPLKLPLRNKLLPLPSLLLLSNNLRTTIKRSAIETEARRERNDLSVFRIFTLISFN